MSESRQGHQTATEGDGDGRVHSRFVKYHYPLALSLFPLPFQPPLPSSTFILPVPSTMSYSSSLLHVLALAISLILLLTLYYFVLAATTPFLQFDYAQFL